MRPLPWKRTTRVSFGDWEYFDDVFSPTEARLRAHKKLVAQHRNSPFVAIQCRDEYATKTFTVHTFILKDLSGLFQTMAFGGNPTLFPQSTVTLPHDVSPLTFPAVNDFLYCREFKMREVHSLPALALLAHRFNLDPLFRVCSHVLLRTGPGELDTLLPQTTIVARYFGDSIDTDPDLSHFEEMSRDRLRLESEWWSILVSEGMLLYALRQALLYYDGNCSRSVLKILSLYATEFSSKELFTVIREMRWRRMESRGYLRSPVSIECSPRLLDMVWEVVGSLPYRDHMLAWRPATLLSRILDEHRRKVALSDFYPWYKFMRDVRMTRRGSSSSGWIRFGVTRILKQPYFLRCQLPAFLMGRGGLLLFSDTRLGRSPDICLNDNPLCVFSLDEGELCKVFRSPLVQRKTRFDSFCTRTI